MTTALQECLNFVRDKLKTTQETNELLLLLTSYHNDLYRKETLNYLFKLINKNDTEELSFNILTEADKIENICVSDRKRLLKFVKYNECEWPVELKIYTSFSSNKDKNTEIIENIVLEMDRYYQYNYKKHGETSQGDFQGQSPLAFYKNDKEKLNKIFETVNEVKKLCRYCLEV
jgi:hypothetical protein